MVIRFITRISFRVHFLAFRVPCRPKLTYFWALSFIKPLEYTPKCKNQKSPFKSSYL